MKNVMVHALVILRYMVRQSGLKIVEICHLNQIECVLVKQIQTASSAAYETEEVCVCRFDWRYKGQSMMNIRE